VKNLYLTRIFFFLFYFLLLNSTLKSQPWQKVDEVFSLRGIPALSFSTPRFADLDGDKYEDMIVGGADVGLVFLKNLGIIGTPNFVLTQNIFEHISELEVVVADFYDIDNDGDYDMVGGGFNGVIYYQNNGTRTNPKFEKNTSLFADFDFGADPVPALGDLNADGLCDLVIGLAENGAILYCFNSGSKNQPVFLPANLKRSGIDVGLFAYPFLADFDRDTDLDLFIGHDESELYYYKNIGTPQRHDFQLQTETFAAIPPENYFVSPALVDLDHDAYLELVYGHYEGTIKYFINEGFNVDPLWVENDIIFGGTITSGSKSDPCLYDVDKDNDFDLISGNAMGEIVFYRNIGNKDSALWLHDSLSIKPFNCKAYTSIAMGDLNNNGSPEMIVSDLTGQLYYLENVDGVFTQNTNFFANEKVGRMGRPYLADMDSDRDFDLLVGNEEGKIVYYENIGDKINPIFQINNTYLSGVQTTHDAAPTAADFDGDGDTDIFLSLGAAVGIVTYFENIGSTNIPKWKEKPEMAEGIKVGQNATPALCDLDNDGDLDLIIGESSGNFVFFKNLKK